MIVGCVVEVSAYVEDAGSVVDGSGVVLAEDDIAVSGTEAYKQTCQLTKFFVYTAICNITASKSVTSDQILI